MNQLRGTLCILDLAHHHHHVSEAKQAEMKKKEHITRLELHFSRARGKESRTLQDLELLEALEPSPSSATSEMKFYEGAKFPGWMILLTNLRSVGLRYCEICELLPPLGKLLSLESLTLQWMEGVKKVGLEFLGLEAQTGNYNSEILSSLSSSGVVAFPKLKRLEFIFRTHWEEWDDIGYDGTSRSAIIMPSLHSLYISSCQRLKALPDYLLQNATLEKLEILGGRTLQERYKEWNEEDWSKISRTPNSVSIEARISRDRHRLEISFVHQKMPQEQKVNS